MVQIKNKNWIMINGKIIYDFGDFSRCQLI